MPESAIPARASSASILVADSDLELAGRICAQLAADGHSAEPAGSADQARRLLLRSGPWRLAIIGELHGAPAAFELLLQIRGEPRERRQRPAVLMLLAAGEREGMIRAVEAGAEDFMARPPAHLELRLRVWSLLRRRAAAERQRTIRADGLTIDLLARRARLHGRTLPLRRLEYELLCRLASDPQRIFSRQELLCSVWGYEAGCATRTVDTHASRLRRKLHAADHTPGRCWILNVRGVGYRLN